MLFARILPIVVSRDHLMHCGVAELVTVEIRGFYFIGNPAMGVAHPFAFLIYHVACRIDGLPQHCRAVGFHLRRQDKTEFHIQPVSG